MTAAGARRDAADPLEGTIVDVLADHARRRGGSVVFSFLHRGEALSDRGTFGELDAAARSVANALVGAGLRGVPVLLPLPSNLDFVRCFLGCLYAGAYAVPAPPLDGRRGAERSAAILQDLGPAGVILPSAEAAERLPLPSGRRDCVVLTAAEVLSAPAAGASLAPRPDDIAFIQYTSGSLGRPRGVVVTHRNIMANQAMIREAFENRPADVVASWLPLHHDMGLIGSVLQSVYVGMHAVLMQPLAFLQKPERWLRAIGNHRASVAGAPNFAFDLCVRQIGEEAVRSLDLSSWRLAFCGAEPVRARTLRAFAGTFKRAGFSEKALMPVYGLAEATLFVSGGRAGQGFRTHRFATEAVSCGRPFCGSRLIVAGPDGAPSPPGATGEICVAGDHVSPGYWSPVTRGARRDEEKMVEMEGRYFLRTGDIGSIQGGSIFVLGRSRDTIIVRGQKIQAEDVEATLLASHAELTAAAAFAVDDGSAESLVVVCEMRRLLPFAGSGSLHSRLKAVVGEAHGIVPRELVLVPSGTIPRTSSGKVRRAACRDLYSEGLLADGRPAGEARGSAA